MARHEPRKVRLRTLERCFAPLGANAGFGRILEHSLVSLTVGCEHARSSQGVASPGGRGSFVLIRCVHFVGVRLRLLEGIKLETCSPRMPQPLYCRIKYSFQVVGSTGKTADNHGHDDDDGRFGAMFSIPGSHATNVSGFRSHEDRHGHIDWDRTPTDLARDSLHLVRNSRSGSEFASQRPEFAQFRAIAMNRARLVVLWTDHGGGTIRLFRTLLHLHCVAKHFMEGRMLRRLHPDRMRHGPDLIMEGGTVVACTQVVLLWSMAVVEQGWKIFSEHSLSCCMPARASGRAWIEFGPIPVEIRTACPTSTNLWRLTRVVPV